MRTKNDIDVTANPLYHDTLKLLKKYRDVVWGLELSVQQVCKRFSIEYGSSIDDFLESIYLAGADLTGSNIEHHAKCIEKSNKMLKLLDTSIELLRTKHKYGEVYYWLLYYSFLCPQQLRNVEEILDQLRPHIQDISYRTYYRKRADAIDALSSILWGYTSRDSMDVLEQFFPD
mgnify:CR=1 FL=1